MKRIRKIAVFTLLVLAILVAGKEEVRNFDTVPQGAQDETRSGLRAAMDFIRFLFEPPELDAPPISEAVNRFGFALLQEFRAANPDDNVVFSPVSLSAAMALVYFGSEGTTKSDLEINMGFTDGVVPDQLRAKAEAIDPERESTAIANRAFFAEDLKIKSSFIEAVGQVNVQSLDFKTDPAAAKKTINDFVEEKTRGLITNMLSDDDVTAATQMVLANAVFFKGAWETLFDEKKTHKAEFRGVDGPVQTDFMEFENEKIELRRKELPDLKSWMVEFPYEDPRFAMYIVLPEDDDGWRFAEEQLLGADAEFFNTDLELIELVVSLPKWEQDSVLNGLMDFLVNLGLGSVFSGADLSGIAENDAGLGVTDIIHKARIGVDEKGTVAAAATVSAVPRTLFDEEFIVDHPFLYFVIDKSDNTIFFQGTVTKF